MGIAGCVGRLEPRGLGDLCAAILDHQAAIGGADRRLIAADGVVFGSNRRFDRPADEIDEHGASGMLLVADARIDNREDLFATLAIAEPRPASISDGSLLLRAWQRWGTDCVNHVMGDYAVALWIPSGRELLLIRSALGTKPLFYHRSDRFVAFAMMPQALHAAGVPRSLDCGHAAAFVVAAQGPGEKSFFSNISRVEQGQMVRISPAGIVRSRGWQPTRAERRGRPVGELAEQMAELLDRAVGATLRRKGGMVASHLSAGRDSNAVSGTAARLLARRGEELIALTAAPPLGFHAPEDRALLVDEAGLAATTARLHPNIRHFVCRHDGELNFARLTQVHRVTSGPLGHLSNHVWWDQLDRTAAAEGATVMLTGGVGNFGLSGGGTSHLVDLIRERGVGSWARHATRAVRAGAATKSVLHSSIGPYLPVSAYKLLMRASGRAPDHRHPLKLLRAPYRAVAAAALETYFPDSGPTASQFALRAELIELQDPSTIASLALYGIETRDPTADRRLIDFCFSLPLEVLISPDNGRPLFEAAMRDRISADVLASRTRGYQGANWQAHLPAPRLKTQFQLLKKHPLVSDLLDVDELDRLIDEWPAVMPDRRSMLFYRNDVLGAISMASFIAANFNDAAVDMAAMEPRESAEV